MEARRFSTVYFTDYCHLLIVFCALNFFSFFCFFLETLMILSRFINPMTSHWIFVNYLKAKKRKRFCWCYRWIFFSSFLFLLQYKLIILELMFNHAELCDVKDLNNELSSSFCMYFPSVRFNNRNSEGKMSVLVLDKLALQLTYITRILFF